MDRCPHSASVRGAGEAALGSWLFAGRTAGLGGAEAVVGLVDLSVYRASRIARIAASLLIVHSPDEL
jgi:hypothetical protein